MKVDIAIMSSILLIPWNMGGGGVVVDLTRQVIHSLRQSTCQMNLPGVSGPTSMYDAGSNCLITCSGLASRKNSSGV